MRRNNNGLIARDPTQKQEFWNEVDDRGQGLSYACGCYVFVLHPSGGGPRPWYIGMTAKRDFRGECLQPHKINLYNDAMAGYNRAAPSLYFISKLTGSGKQFAKPSSNGHGDIKTLEDLLIGMAYARNQKLLNIRGTKFFKEAVVPGVMNSPKRKPHEAETSLRGILLP